MHREYAIDPSILISFDRIRGLLDTCGWHKGKLVCEYPKKRWKRDIYDTCKVRGDRQRKALEELLQAHPFVRRNDPHRYCDNSPWLNSAKAEHKRKAFTAIVSDTADLPASVIDGQYVTEGSEPLWAPPSGILSRTAADFASAILLLAQNASRIIFVDPYFQTNERRFTEPFLEMLKTAVGNFYKRPGNGVVFELHVSESAGNRKHIETTLPLYIPQGLKVRVYRWKEHSPARAESERLHNRYVLTEIGGVSFGIGLDQSGSNGTIPPESDDINILTRDQHQMRIKQYRDGSQCFDALDAPFEVVGISTR